MWGRCFYLQACLQVKISALHLESAASTYILIWGFFSVFVISSVRLVRSVFVSLILAFDKKLFFLRFYFALTIIIINFVPSYALMCGGCCRESR